MLVQKVLIMFIIHRFQKTNMIKMINKQPHEPPSLFVAVKKRNNWHRHDYTEPDDGSKPVQAGTSVFIKELQNRTFARYVSVWTMHILL